MNTARLNAPMTWPEFKALSDDTKKLYLTRCIDNGGNATRIADMLGVSRTTIHKLAQRLDVAFRIGPPTTSHVSAWYTFLSPAAPVPEEPKDAPQLTTEREVESVPVQPQKTYSAEDVKRTFSCLHLRYTGTAKRVLTFLLMCGVGQDDDTLFDIDLRFMEADKPGEEEATS